MAKSDLQPIYGALTRILTDNRSVETATREMLSQVAKTEDKSKVVGKEMMALFNSVMELILDVNVIANQAAEIRELGSPSVELANLMTLIEGASYSPSYIAKVLYGAPPAVLQAVAQELRGYEHGEWKIAELMMALDEARSVGK